MIGKHIKGKDFSRCLNYVITKPGARVIGGSLLALTPEGANRELQEVAAMSPRTQKPLLHCALSLAAGESLSNHQWRMLTEQYLKALGYIQNQFLLVRHSDTPTHEHVHVVVNRVGLDGRTVSDSWDYMRSQAVIHDLETEYGLVHAPLSWEKRKQKPNQEAAYEQQFSEPALHTLPPSVQQQVRWQRQLRSHLNGALVAAWDVESLSEQLAHQGVQLRLLHRQGKAVGISFWWQGQKIAGSRLGAAYSLPKLLAVMNGAIPYASPPLSPVTPDMEQEITAEQPDAERLGAIRQPETGQGNDIHDPEAVIHQFEPDETLPAAHQRYLQLEALVRQQFGPQATRRQIDLQIAQWVLRANRPEKTQVLIYSPEIERVRRQQGERVAMDVLRQLMREVQRQSHFTTDVSHHAGSDGLER